MKRIAVLFPILAGILFGSVGVFVRRLSAFGFTNPSIIFIRTSLAAVMMLIFILVKDKSLLKPPKGSIPYILCCGIIGMMGTNLTFNISSTRLSLAFAAVLLSIAPVYTVILSRFLFRESITVKKVICMLMTILGCVLVSGVIGSAVQLSAVGVIAGIISGVTYGLYSIFSKLATEKGARSYTITFYCLLMIAVVLSPFADYQVIASFAAQAPAQNILFLLLHALLVAVLPYLLITMSVSYIDAGKVSILASCEPVAAMVFGALFFSEIPTVISVLGLCVTLAALTLLCRKEKAAEG